MLPATQTVAPVHPFPPHCPYFGAAATLVCVGGVEVVAAAEEDTAVLEGAVLDTAALLEGLVTTPPGPATDLVSSPDSMYTPLK